MNSETFIFENYYKGIGFVKKSSYYSMKHLRKKRLFVASKQINRKKLILVMPWNIIILILREKTQNH